MGLVAALEFIFHSHITLSIFISVLLLFWIDSSLSFLWAGSLFSFHQTFAYISSLLCENPTKKFQSLQQLFIVHELHLGCQSIMKFSIVLLCIVLGIFAVVDASVV